MAKSTELFDIVMSKEGDRMVAKLNAEKLVATAYDGTEIILNKGDYLNIQGYDDVVESLDYLLQNDFMKQKVYDAKVDYLTKIRPSFRARVIARTPKK